MDITGMSNRRAGRKQLTWLFAVAMLAPLVPGVTTSAVAAGAEDCELRLDVNHFETGAWARSDDSVTVGDGKLVIAHTSGYNSGMALPCRASFPLEVTGRIVTGGQNYVFPWLQVRLTDGSTVTTTSLPDSSHGWALQVCDADFWPASEEFPWSMTHVLQGDYPGECSEDMWQPEGLESVAEGAFLTLRLDHAGTDLQLFAQTSPGGSFHLAHEVPLSIDVGLDRISISQPWDAHVEVTSIAVGDACPVVLVPSISNPGFERPSCGWRFDAQPQYGDDMATRDTSQSHTGAASARLTLRWGGGEVEQRIPVQPSLVGRSVVMDYWALMPHAGSQANKWLTAVVEAIAADGTSLGDTTLGQFDALPSWTHRTTEPLPILDGAVELRVAFHTKNGNGGYAGYDRQVWMDDVSLRILPDESSHLEACEHTGQLADLQRTAQQLRSLLNRSRLDHLETLAELADGERANAALLQHGRQLDAMVKDLEAQVRDLVVELNSERAARLRAEQRLTASAETSSPPSADDLVSTSEAQTPPPDSATRGRFDTDHEIRVVPSPPSVFVAVAAAAAAGLAFRARSRNG